MVSSTTNTTPSILAGDEGGAGGRPNRCPGQRWRLRRARWLGSTTLGCVCFCWLAGEKTTRCAASMTWSASTQSTSRAAIPSWCDADRSCPVLQGRGVLYDGSSQAPAEGGAAQDRRRRLTGAGRV